MASTPSVVSISIPEITRIPYLFYAENQVSATIWYRNLFINGECILSSYNDTSSLEIKNNALKFTFTGGSDVGIGWPVKYLAIMDAPF